MGMLAAIGLTGIGLVLLLVGAEFLTRSGTRLAGRLGISPTIIGLTVVALGTSTPELAVGIDAALTGNGDLAVGNIAGTNVVNILLILGLSAAMRRLALSGDTLWLDLPMIVAASLAFLVMASDYTLSRTDGMLLVLGAVVYTVAIVHVARRQSRAARNSAAAAMAADPLQTGMAGSRAMDFATLVAGISVIVLGADWLVEGAVTLAKLWNVSDGFIGLTVVAIGTSAPELATTVISTLRNQRDIAIGNLIGSSTYNILCILGITAIVPAGGIPISTYLVEVDVPVMAAVALLCLPVFHSGREVSRREGAMFVAIYVIYLAYLVLVRT